MLAYLTPDPDQPFGDNPGAEKSARRALAGVTVSGAPVHLTGMDALQDSSGGNEGPGVLVEALVGGLGALLVLAFVFGSLLALVPLLMALPAILAAFLARSGGPIAATSRWASATSRRTRRRSRRRSPPSAPSSRT